MARKGSMNARQKRRVLQKEIDKVLTSHPCGACTECCARLAIEEIKKPQFVPCPNVKPGGGCSIYSKRPKPCRDFNCLWKVGITDGLLEGDAGRPDKLGLMFDLNDTHDTGIQLVVVHELRKGAAKEALGHLHSIASRGHVVYIVPRDPTENRKMLGPEEKVQRIQEIARKRLPLVMQ